MIFLDDVVDAWAGEGEPNLPEERIGWRNPRPNGAIKLAELTWNNPHPEKTITTLDFVSSLRKAGPFLVAITVKR